MIKTIESGEAKRVVGSIEQENITITCDDDGLPSFFVKAPDLSPLSLEENAAKLRIVGEDYDFHVFLNSKQLDQLEGAIHKTQKHLMESRE